MVYEGRNLYKEKMNPPTKMMKTTERLYTKSTLTSPPFLLYYVSTRVET